MASNVTAVAGIVKVQGLLEEPPEQEAPDMVQLENCQSAEGVALTEINELTVSEQPLGQLGQTEPEPEETFVVRVQTPTETIWPFIKTRTAEGVEVLVQAVHVAATQPAPLYHSLSEKVNMYSGYPPETSVCHTSM
jgi:hypothetical protein